MHVALEAELLADINKVHVSILKTRTGMNEVMLQIAANTVFSFAQITDAQDHIAYE